MRGAARRRHRFRAALAVAGGPRLCARALRSDPEAALIGNPRDRAAAGTDLENVHHRDLDRQGALVAADERAAGGQCLTVVDDPGLRRGAAHIESDGVLHAQRIAQCLRADDAGGRAGFQHADALALRLLAIVEPAGRLHDEEGSVEPVGPDAVIDAADIAFYPGADISVGDDRRTAFEFAVFLAQFMRCRHEGVR